MTKSILLVIPLILIALAPVVYIGYNCCLDFRPKPSAPSVSREQAIPMKQSMFENMLTRDLFPQDKTEVEPEEVDRSKARFWY